jgi:hypothetical protein
MNVGLSLILIPLSLFLLQIGFYLYKEKKGIARGFISIGIIISILMILLLTGIYDPHSNSISR